MSNLPPGVTQHDIDLHLEGVNCEDCGIRFIPDNDEDLVCKKCGVDPDLAREDRDEMREMVKGRSNHGD